MRQFVVTTSDGRVFGIVLDESPMTDAQARAHVSAFGARTLADVTRWQAFVTGDRNTSTVSEIMHRPRRFAASGRVARRYPEVTYCRPLAA